MADMLAQVWLWIADRLEGRPVAAIVVAVAFGALIAAAAVVVPR